MNSLENLLDFELDEAYIRYKREISRITYKNESTFKEQLDKIPISEIEAYLRRKKLENINGLPTK